MVDGRSEVERWPFSLPIAGQSLRRVAPLFANSAVLGVRAAHFFLVHGQFGSTTRLGNDRDNQPGAGCHSAKLLARREGNLEKAPRRRNSPVVGSIGLWQGASSSS